MSRSPSTSLVSYRRVAWRGFKLGYGLALAYSLLFELVVVAATSWEIGDRLGWGEGVLGTLAANALSFFVGVTALALLFSLLPGLLVMLALLLTRVLLPLLATEQPERRAPAVAVLITAGLLLLINLIAWRAGGEFFLQLGWPGYLFWLGLPGILFVTAVARRASTFIMLK